MENRSVNLSKVLPRRLTNTLDDIWLFVYTEYLMHVPRRLRHLGSLRSFLQKLESKPNTQCCKPSSETPDPLDFYHALNNKTNNVQQFCIEPYILQGYALSNMPLRYYVKLLVVPTNELLNVWTHLVPCMWFIWMLAEYNQTLDLLQSWPVLITVVSAIIMTLFSSLAHLFHTRSSYEHSCWFMADYFGIVMFAYSSTVAHFFASSRLSYYNRFGWINLVVLTVVAGVGFFCFSITQSGMRLSRITSRRLKVLPTMGGYLYGMLPLIHRYLISTEEDPAMFYHKLQFVFMFLCPLFYASDIPQKFWPGRFDILGHSHQFFHICAALSCYCDIIATHYDVTDPTGPWAVLQQQADFPPFEMFCVCTLTLVCHCAFIAVSIARNISHCKS